MSHRYIQPNVELIETVNVHENAQEQDMILPVSNVSSFGVRAVNNILAKNVITTVAFDGTRTTDKQAVVFSEDVYDQYIDEIASSS